MAVLDDGVGVGGIGGVTELQRQLKSQGFFTIDVPGPICMGEPAPPHPPVATVALSCPSPLTIGRPDL